MPSSILADVAPAVLRWARESIGLTPLAAARKLGLPDGRVDGWEQGQASPTVVQLRAAALVYKRPLGVFFLPAPPLDFDAMRDFRRLPHAEAGTWSSELHGEYRRAQTQRDYLLDLLAAEDEIPPTTWRLEDLPDDNEVTAALARARLLGQAPLPLPRAANADPRDHLNAWVAALEHAGVLVLATSRGAVKTSEMRAFSLYYDKLPVIMVNGADSARGRLFSLLHEYAHLLLHTAGLCTLETVAQATTPDQQLEARCNALAAAALMPSGAVRTQRDVVDLPDDPTQWTYELLRRAAALYGVSAEAMLRRLTTLGQVPVTIYDQRRAGFLAAYDEEQARSKATGGDWYRNTVRDLGKGYVRRVSDAHRRRVIDSYTAATYLNAKVGQIDRLAAAATLTPASA